MFATVLSLGDSRDSTEVAVPLVRKHWMPGSWVWGLRPSKSTCTCVWRVYLYIHLQCQKSRKGTNKIKQANKHRHIYIYIHIHVYTYMHIERAWSRNPFVKLPSYARRPVGMRHDVLDLCWLHGCGPSLVRNPHRW